MAKGDKPKELFTASEVARFCQVDLKTIHNWSDRGEIRHFRTPGRHLRFRRVDVLDFLRKYGYPIPEILTQGRPKVVLLGDDAASLDAVAKALGDDFQTTTHTDPVNALVDIGVTPPDVVAVSGRVGGLDGVTIIAGLKQNDATQHVRTVLLSDGEADRQAALDAGASAHVTPDGVPELRETLAALLGLHR